MCIRDRVIRVPATTTTTMVTGGVGANREAVTVSTRGGATIVTTIVVVGGATDLEGFNITYTRADILHPNPNVECVIQIPHQGPEVHRLSLIHISEPTRLLSISYAVFCLKKKKEDKE
eukprot:TRINITY_DN14159_c0_g1_i1.p2 TRINITY_DN14159_c0_g1~~TRINITY_DN14159_c0_g1_i1.p2  ORF type:complete len:118 (-),score=29.70 TRINITY_DN14159_c0_g1_i1:100-453(-)